MVPLTPTAYWRGQVDTTLKDHGERLDDVEDRTIAIEKFMWKIMGAAVVGSVLGGGIVTVIAYLVVGALNHH